MDVGDADSKYKHLPTLSLLEMMGACIILCVPPNNF